MTNEELAEKFEVCAGAEGPLYPAMLSVGVPIKDRLQMYHTFESDKLFSDPMLYFDTIATRNWRATAFCFAAAMVRGRDWR